MRTIFNHIPPTVRAILLVILFAIGMGGVGYGVNSALNGVDENQQVQIERCEAGNKQKIGLQDYFQEQLDEVKGHGVAYYQNYLNGTEAQIRQLRRESIEKLETDVNERFAPEDCEAIIK